MNCIINYKPCKYDEIDYTLLSIIENKIKNKISLTEKELHFFLTNIIYMTRKNINPKLDNYDNKCDLAQSILYYYLNSLNCQCTALTTQETITSEVVGHSFIVIKILIDNKLEYYLLDPTYIQFFKKENCTKEKYLINPNYPNYLLLVPDPGYFIKKPIPQEIISLLNNGYLKLTEETAKIYGDSFYNTKRGYRFNGTSLIELPDFVYMNAFTTSRNTNLSKTEAELVSMNLTIPLSSNTTSKTTLHK